VINDKSNASNSNRNMNEIQKKLTDKLLSSNLEGYPAGLFYGKTGLAIYLYRLAKIESNPEYRRMAEQLLDRILLHDLSPGQSVDVEDGLAGVGLGITYLIQNRFEAGDINQLLEGIDNAIYRRIVFQQNPSTFSATQLLHLTGYLYIRLKDLTDANAQMLYRELIIKALNMLYSRIDDEFLNETCSFSICDYQLPVLLWVFGRLLEAGFYNDRIYSILDELQPRILSRFPLLHSNRLFLLWGMLHLKPFVHAPAWSGYIELLYREISVDEILENEMTGRKIFINNGLSGIYILLYAINTGFPDYPVAFDPQKMYDRIQNSDARNAMIERDYFYKIHHGLLNGFPGVQLVCHELREFIRNRSK